MTIETARTCHGDGGRVDQSGSRNRLAGKGPALLPENLRRLRKAKAAKVIAEGRAAKKVQAIIMPMTRDLE